MSSQGTGYPSQNRGMKNTTDPRSNDPTYESAGPVASDSLAAESYNADGEFANNRNAAPSGVRGEASTYNNDDTSAASRLDPVSDSGDRDDGYSESDRGASGGVRYAEGLGGQPKFSGATTAGGYSGGPSDNSGSRSSGGDNSYSRDDSGDASRSGGRSDNDYRGSAGNNSSSVDKAPNYIADVYLGDTSKPKGKNLTEDENMTGNRKYDGDIGSKNDPGRAALRDFETSNSSVATGQADGAQESLDSDNTYDELRRDERA